MIKSRRVDAKLEHFKAGQTIFLLPKQPTLFS